MGCGAGNTLFPLLDANPSAFAYACDFSPSAVRLVRAHAAYARGRARAFVADITQPGALAGGVPGGAADVCTLVFVLSAISPEKMPQVCAPWSGFLGSRVHGMPSQKRSLCDRCIRAGPCSMTDAGYRLWACVKGKLVIAA